jgi:hypothetical protein
MTIKGMVLFAIGPLLSGCANSYHQNSLATNGDISAATAYCKANHNFDLLGIGGSFDRCMSEHGWDKDSAFSSGGK